MVNGLIRWKEYFGKDKDKYVLIGGAACNLLEEELEMNPRATKDLDLVLVVEALTPDFGMRLWNFIKDGNYESRSRGENEHLHEYYRFMNPQDKSYPKQIELFARNTGKLNLPTDAHIEPISMGEDLSSLSAILMDDDYYSFTINHCQDIDEIHIASPEALICLKAKAYIEMLDRKAQGEQIDSRDMEKHKKDIFRLIAMIPQNAHFELPEKLRHDIEMFCERVGELPNQDFFKSSGLHGLVASELMELLHSAFIGPSSS